MTKFTSITALIGKKVKIKIFEIYQKEIKVIQFMC